MENLDGRLIRKCLSVLSDRYATESGKKFILHLISAFIPKDEKAMDILSNGDQDESTCCLSKVNIVPTDVPIDLNPKRVIVDFKVKYLPRENYYGYRSDLSTKVVSREGLEALRQFVELRSAQGDDVIGRIHKYITKNKDNTINEKTKKFIDRVKELKDPNQSKTKPRTGDIIPSRPK